MKISCKKSLKQTVFSAALAGLSSAFVLFVCLAQAVPLAGENTVDVYNSTVRLRVVANSDSERDQALKLAVRNDIIGLASEIFKDCDSMEDARRAVNANLDLLEQAAARSTAVHGAGEPVKVSFGTEKCPVRRYSAFTFPAGEYLTLRVNIGKAAGENWWCVMYPPLCVSAATNDVYADRETFLSYGFSTDQIDALTDGDAQSEKPVVRSAIVDFFAGLFS